MEKNIVWNKTYLSLIIFSLIIFLFFPSGIILVGDWTSPASDLQMDKYLHPYTWNYQLNNGIDSSHHLAALPFKVIIYFFAKIISYNHLNFFVFFIIQFLGFYSVYKLLGYLKLSQSTILILSILYPLNPINYNFVVFGWIYAVIAINTLPLAVYFWLKSFNNNNYIFRLLLLVIIFSLQSQAILWLTANIIFFSILYSKYIINHKKIFFNFFLILFSYFLINLYWLLPLIFGDDIYLQTSINLGLEDVSIGQDSKWNLLNSAKLLNSTFNSQFSSNLGILKNIMFIIPISFIINILLNKNKEYFIKLLLIYITVLLVLNLIIENRNYFFQIPGTNIFRHISRNLVLIILICYLSLAFFLEKILVNNKKETWFLILLVICVMISPWVNKKENTLEGYMIKKFEIPEYFKFLDNEIDLRFSPNEKIIKIPTGIAKKYSYKMNNFNEDYREINDIFALWGKIPSLYTPDLLPHLNKSLFSKNYIQESNINGIIIDKQFNTSSTTDFLFLESIKKTGYYEIKEDNIFFSIYEKKIKTPLLYIKNQSNEFIKVYIQRVSPVKINILMTITDDQFYKLSFLENFNISWELDLYFEAKKIHLNNNQVLKHFKEFKVNEAIVNFNSFSLEKKHNIKNTGKTFNNFLIDISKLCANDICDKSKKTILMQLNYKSQNYFKLGLIISSFYIFGIFLLIIFKLKKNA